MIGKGSIGMLNAKRRAAKRGWLLGTLFALVILVAPRLMPGNMALGPWVYPIIKGLVYPARLTERLPGDFLGNAHAGPSLLGMVLWFAVHFAFYGCVGSIVARLWVWYRDHRLPEGSCQTCSYDLTGNVSGVCPECGTKIRWTHRATPRP